MRNLFLMFVMMSALCTGALFAEDEASQETSLPATESVQPASENTTEKATASNEELVPVPS